MSCHSSLSIFIQLAEPRWQTSPWICVKCKSYVEASFLLQTVWIFILRRSWLVAVFQKRWWIIHSLSGGCVRVCVCVEDFLASSRQVFPPSPGTEMPTSPSTRRMSRPALQTPSTRPRTTSPASARTESRGRWAAQCSPPTLNAAIIVPSASF